MLSSAVLHEEGKKEGREKGVEYIQPAVGYG